MEREYQKLLKIGDVMIIERGVVADMYVRDGINADSFVRVDDASELSPKHRNYTTGLSQGGSPLWYARGYPYIVVALNEDILDDRRPLPHLSGNPKPSPKNDLTLVEFNCGQPDFSGPIIRIRQSMHSHPPIHGYIDGSIYALSEIGVCSRHPITLARSVPEIKKRDVTAQLKLAKAEACQAKERAIQDVLAAADLQDRARPLMIRARPVREAKQAVA
jgi:hypothetical protein